MKYLDEVDSQDPHFGDFYDELPLWSAPFGLQLLDRVPVGPGLTILDVGAGTGFLTLELAQRCGSESTVIAVDPWTAATRRFRQKLERLGLRNVVLLEQDAEALELDDGSIDVIVSNLGINNFENVDQVLLRLFRAAKPNARLVLTTNLEGHMAEFYAVFRETLIELGQGDRLAAFDAHVRHRGTVDSIGTTLREAGFTVVDTETDHFRIRFANGSAMLRHHLIRIGFIPAWKALVTGDQLHTTFETLERNLNTVAEREGELALTIPTALIEARK